jgi:hypothetical protein
MTRTTPRIAGLSEATATSTPAPRLRSTPMGRYGLTVDATTSRLRSATASPPPPGKFNTGLTGLKTGFKHKIQRFFHGLTESIAQIVSKYTYIYINGRPQVAPTVIPNPMPILTPRRAGRVRTPAQAALRVRTQGIPPRRIAPSADAASFYTQRANKVRPYRYLSGVLN